jgi:hypothetical protein
LLPLLALWTMQLSAADRIDELDADFLDYLAEMEADDEDDWTLLADTQAQAKSVVKKASEENESTKANKEAVTPAVDER